MRKFGFASLRALKVAAVFAVFSASLVPPAPSFAGGIQMLPPVKDDGSNKPCDTGSGGMLQWDGQGAITCVPAISGDARGNVTVAPGSNLNLQGGLYVNGNAAVFGNAFSTPQSDPITIADFKNAQCPGGGNVGFDGSGTLQCCPAGTVVLAAAPHSVTCGTLPITK
jgi:hypothetical protein